jgi:hypothetical protein
MAPRVLPPRRDDSGEFPPAPCIPLAAGPEKREHSYRLIWGIPVKGTAMLWTFNDRQDERWALIRREDTPNKNLAIFVHGFRGTHLTTWGELPDFLKRHAGAESPLMDWDYLFIGYQTYSIKNYLNIADIIATEWSLASQGKPPYRPNKYDKLGLFGHSLGTLGIRQLLFASAMHPPGMLKALHCVALLGSPINGSPLAIFGPLFRTVDALKGNPAALRPGSYAIAESLRPGGAPLTMLHAWNKSARTHLGGLKVCLRLGTDDEIVGDGGLVEWEGDKKQTKALGHSQLCKIAKNEKGQFEGHLLDLLREQLA